MEKFLLSSHNSWSYLRPKKWWMWPFAFMAKCQRVDIRKQYYLGVRCFDLRIRFTKDGRLQVAHGMMVYDISSVELKQDLKWIHEQGGCMIRLMHEVRRKSEYTWESLKLFREWCNELEVEYYNIDFWGGQNLYNCNYDYDFWCKPSCDEKYASVCKPKLIDDWWPWRFAYFNNHHILEQGSEKEILMIDFVDIG